MTTPSFTGHRQVEIEVMLLDQGEQEKGVLKGVVGGEVTLSASTRLKASGSLELIDMGQDINWARDRVRITYKITGGASWPLGVFLLAAPTKTYRDGGATWNVELLSKLTLLDEDCVESPTQVGTSYPALSLLQFALVDVGKADITESAARLASTMTWEAGTPRLTIFNDILEAIGYWSMNVSGSGAFQIRPYIPPAQRPLSWQFTEGETSIHLPEWSREQDLAGIPNKVVLVSQGGDDKPALVGIARNMNPSSPASYPSRGRWITHTETGVEASTQEVITQLAEKKLLEAQTAIAKIEIEHLPVPIWTNDLVEFSSQGVRTRATIQSIKYDLSPDRLCKTTLREVQS